MTLIPEFVEGRLVRYVINTDDALGHALDLRKDTGQLHRHDHADRQLRQRHRARRVDARRRSRSRRSSRSSTCTSRPSYVEGLRDFGLRAVDEQIRDRILAVCNEAYQGVNIDFRTDPPTDFALFENVELVGVDPNNMGLFGYDNSPGKDNGNLRLYDELGGVNAVTQEDGYPGYGGVFVRSLMGFSKHPGAFAQTSPGADADVRPDLRSVPRRLRAARRSRRADLAAASPVLDRRRRVPGQRSRRARSRARSS